MKTCEPYSVKIYCGLKEGYDGYQHPVTEAYEVCQKYCDEVGLCVTVTNTHFVYKDGNEDGVIVGLIQYPRFPKFNVEIDNLAIRLGYILMEKFKQQRVTIETTDRMIMLEQSDEFMNIVDPNGKKIHEVVTSSPPKLVEYFAYHVVGTGDTSNDSAKIGDKS